MKKYLLLLSLVWTLSVAFSQQRIPLYEGTIPNSKAVTALTDSTVYFKNGERDIPFVIRVAEPDLTLYLPEKGKGTGAAVIICPGGGYTGLANGHEGDEMAQRFQENGIAGIVLKYRLPNSQYVDNKAVVPLQDAQRAIQLVREHAQQWGISFRRIGILGSSAGGHLASTAGTHFRDVTLENPVNTSLRPDFMVLNYPVISFADSLTHEGSRANLIGPRWTAKEVAYYSNELQVTPETPPTFITHAVDDDVVKVQNSLVFIAALQQNKVPVQSVIYTHGGHGYGMKNPTSDMDWMDSCIQWIKSGFKSMEKPNEWEIRQSEDWAWLKRFEKDNQQIAPASPKEKRVVFMGNSITEGWVNADPAFFQKNPYIGRGISGQTTPQMLLRFRQDVIDLKPAVVVILAGTNDIAGNTGPMTLEQTMDNIASMAELAKANNIRVVLSSVLPAYDYPWKPGMEPALKIVRLNEMIREYAARNGCVYLDYFTPMADEKNGLKANLGDDGVHPNLEGYKIMEPLVQKAIGEALKLK